jgi:hypothetical protein
MGLEQAAVEVKFVAIDAFLYQPEPGSGGQIEAERRALLDRLPGFTSVGKARPSAVRR